MLRGILLALLRASAQDCTSDLLTTRDEACEAACEATGCELSLLGDGHCDSLCASAACFWDLGDCGDCAAGCFQTQLANSVCDSACSTAACEWDGGDCDCAPGCTAAMRTAAATELLCCSYACDYQGRNLACVSADCAVGCRDRMVNDGVCDPACDTAACLWDGSDCRCAPACAHDLLADGNCDPACLSSQCDFDGGDCQPVSYFVGYVPDSDLSASSSDNPADSLSDLLSTVEDPRVEVFLLAGQWPLVAPTNFTLLRDRLEPLSRTDSDRAPKSVLITTLLCDSFPDSNCADSRATIRFTDAKIRFVIEGELILQSVIIDGSVSLKPGCSSCVYCPTLRLSRGEVVDDRGMPLPTWSVPDKSKCLAYSAWTPFSTSGTMIATDVDVQNFRMQLMAVIELRSGSVSLTRVNFSGITLAMTDSPSAVILQVAAHPGGTLNYAEGSVTLLNDNYEYQSDILLHGFILAQSLTTVRIRAVKFAYNMVLSAASVALLHFGSFLQLEVSGCSFDWNLATAGMIAVAAEQLPFRRSQVRDGKLSDSYLVHVQLSDLSFAGNYAERALVDLSYAVEQQNIELAALTFESNASGPLLAVLGPDPPVFSGEKLESALTVARRTLRISRLTARNNAASSGLVSVVRAVNVDICDLTLEQNTDTLDSGPNEIVLPAFREMDYYLSLQLPVSHSDECAFALALSGTINASAANSTVTSNVCSKGADNFLVSNCSGELTVRNWTFSGNTGSDPRSTSMSVSDCKQLSASGLNFTENQNADAGGSAALRLSQVAEATVTDSEFAGNAGRGAALSIGGGTSMTLERCTFQANSAVSGGAVLVQSSLSRLSVTACSFSRNVASAAGGAVSLLPSSLLTLAVADCDFVSNSAGSDGSALFFSLSLATKSYIRNTRFTDNACPGVGTVHAAMTVGQLSLSDCQWVGNAASRGSALFLAGTAFIQQSLIANQTTGAAIELAGGATLSTARVEFRSNLQALVSRNAQWTDSFSAFTGSTAGAVLLEGGSATLDSAVFTANRNTACGGAVSAENSAQVTCRACSFLSNKSGSKGGAVFVTTSAALNLASCVFQENASKEGAAFFLLSASLSTFTTGVVRLNKAEKAAIGLLDTTLILAKSQIDSNTATGGTAGIAAFLSVLSVSSSVFRNQTGASGVFFFLGTGTDFYLSNSSLSNCSGSDSGAILAVSSTLTLSAVRFFNCAAKHAAALVASETSVSMLDCGVRNCTVATGGLVEVTGSPVTVESCSFADFSGSGLVLTRTTRVLFASSSFSRAASGSAFLCSDCNDTTVRACTFDNMAGLDTGAVTILSNSRSVVSIENCAFRGNSAVRGAAVYAENADLSVSGTDFLENQAREGGAVWFACANCAFALHGGTMVSNTADSGGAVQWSGSKPTISSVTMERNSAAYGANLASSPAKLAVINEAGVPDKYTETMGEAVAATLTYVASGQSLRQLRLALLDHYDSVVTSDSHSLCRIDPVSPQTVSLSGPTQAAALSGICDFSGLVVTTAPGYTVALRVSVAGLRSVLIEAEMRDCLAGEGRVDSECEACVAGTYSFSVNSQCAVCPAAAICYGNWSMVPREGFWRSSMYSPVVTECWERTACAGSPAPPQRLALTGLCASGYRSNLCATCAEGYSRSGATKCEPCLPAWRQAFKTACVTLSALVMLMIVLWSVAVFVRNPDSECCALWKILASHLQLSLLITSLRLAWPRTASQAAETAAQAVLLPEQLFGLDCQLQGDFRTRLLGGVLLPPVVFFFSLCFSGVRLLLSRQPSLLKTDIIASNLILLYMSHPSLVRRLLETFLCVSIEARGEFLFVHSATRCWQHDHNFDAFALALPSLLVWVCAVPLLSFALLARVKPSADVTSALQLGFISAGYSDKARFWEATLYVCKTSLAGCAALLPRAAALQGFFALATLACAQLLHLQVRPLSTTDLNVVAMSSWSVLATIVFGAMVSAHIPGETWLWPTVYWLCVSVFAVVWLRKAVGLAYLSLKKQRSSAETLPEFLQGSLEVQSAALPTRLELCLGRLRREFVQFRGSFEDFRPSKAHLYASPPPKKAQKPVSEDDVQLSDRNPHAGCSSSLIGKPLPVARKPVHRYNSEAKQASKGLFDHPPASLTDRPGASQ